MKRNITAIILILATLISANGCLGSLDVKQKGTIDANSMWQDEEDFKAAMYGCLYSFRAAYKVNNSYWGDFRSGVIGKGLGSFNATAHVTNKLTSADGKGTNWETLYKCINDCNVTIRHLGEFHFSDTELRDRIAANCYFLRAFCYFTIVRVWGDAPILLDGIESSRQDGLLPARADAALIYAQIAEDIDRALSLMPASVVERTAGSVAAINMLKTDYCLWMYRTRNAGADALTGAEEAVDAVISDGNYELLPKYADVFDVANEKNREIIFALPFTKITEEVTVYCDDYLIPVSKYGDAAVYKDNEQVKVGSDDQWYSFTEAFQNFIYENSSDTRAKTSFARFTVPETGTVYSWINKFPGEWENGVRYFSSDLPMYRFAEALLFKAEIVNEKGEDASPWLNRIAKRAYGSDIYTAMDHDSMNEAIFNERLKEFTAECKSWWDYIRMGYAFTKIPSLVGRQNETNVLLWPISSDCFSDNPNIRQTVGFN